MDQSQSPSNDHIKPNQPNQPNSNMNMNNIDKYSYIQNQLFLFEKKFKTYSTIDSSSQSQTQTQTQSHVHVQFSQGIIKQLQEISKVLNRSFQIEKISLKKNQQIIKKYKQLVDMIYDEINHIRQEHFINHDDVRLYNKMINERVKVLKDKELRFVGKGMGIGMGMGNEIKNYHDVNEKDENDELLIMLYDSKGENQRLLNELENLNAENRKLRKVPKPDVKNLIKMTLQPVESRIELSKIFENFEKDNKVLEEEIVKVRKNNIIKDGQIRNNRQEIINLKKNLNVREKKFSKVTKIKEYERQRANLMKQTKFSHSYDQTMYNIFQIEEDLISERKKYKVFRENSLRTELQLRNEIERLQGEIKNLREKGVDLNKDKQSTKVEIIKEEEKEEKKVENKITTEYNRKEMISVRAGDDIFSRSAQTNPIDWCEYQINYLFKLMNEMFFIRLNKKPNQHFLKSFFTLNKGVKLIYQALMEDNKGIKKKKNLPKLKQKKKRVYGIEEHDPDVIEFKKRNSKKNLMKKRNARPKTGIRRIGNPSVPNFTMPGYKVSRIPRLKSKTFQKRKKFEGDDIFHTNDEPQRWNQKPKMKKVNSSKKRITLNLTSSFADFY